MARLTTGARGYGPPGDEAEALLVAMAGSAPVLLWMSDLEGQFLCFNNGWLSFTGRRLDRELEAGWAGAIHPDDREHRLAVQRKAMERHDPFEAEYRMRRHDGAWRWVLDRGVPLEGPVEGYVGACVDITERRAVEEDLHRSREELRLVLAAGNMGTWIWDRQADRVVRDDNLQSLYGLEPGAPGGTYDEWVTLVHPEDRDRVLEGVARAVAEGVGYDLEHRIVRPDGSVRWLERRGEAFYDDEGRVVGTRGVVVDITRRKETEAERDRLLESEREARRAAEMAARRLAHLQAVTAGLADARTTEEVAEVVVVEGARCLEARGGLLCVLDRDGKSFEIVRQVGYDAATVERFRHFPVDADLPASQAVRTGEIVLIGSLEERDRRYPALAGLPSPNHSMAAVPVRPHRRPPAAIVLSWPGPRSFGDDDRGFLLALGQQAAQALDRAQFYEDEQWNARRQAFLAEASRLLGSSLDYSGTLRAMTRLAVPVAGDACSIHLLEEGELRTLAVAHVDPQREEVMGLLGAGPWWTAGGRLLEAAVQGRRLVEPRVDGAAVEAGPEEAEVLRRLGTRSAMAVPLVSQNETLGMLVVAMDISGRRYGEQDLPFLDDLAARASAAIANGRFHQVRSEIARTLQRSLLPPQVPAIPALDVAARYRPVGDAVEVGGDFYDVFRAGDDLWGVVIGDVSGKGILAASLTALARHTVRTAARREATPSAVLRVLNSNIVDNEVDERFCTVALAFFRQDPDGVVFSLACGGHPLPLLVDRSGTVVPVGRPGTALGLLAEPDLEDREYRLPPGHTLVLFTDGVVEARSPEGLFADGLLEETLARCAGMTAAEVADTVEAALLDFVGGRPRDDTALLVVRRPPEPAGGGHGRAAHGDQERPPARHSSATSS